MKDQLRQEWFALLQALAVDPVLAEQTFDDIANRYAEPGRFYHNLEHIQNVLHTVATLDSHSRNRNVLKLAAWLHDVIYDSRASDNEERSADYAVALCEKLAIPDGTAVASLILKTKTHDAGADVDAQVLLDADLAILGASETDYRIYAENIRKEYAWVPNAEYRAGRRQVLERFLARPRIYHWLLHLEERARRNLEAERDHLKSQLATDQHG